jgi:hypothetical protein
MSVRVHYQFHKPSVSKKEYVMHLMMFEIHYAQKYDFFGDWIMCLRYSCY